MTRTLATLTLSILAAAAFAAGPGGGGMPPGGGGQPGGNQPGGGASATFTFDTFLAASDDVSGLLVRENVVIGYASPTAPAVSASVTALADGALAGCATLTAIDLSATAIAAIPEAAFCGCSALETVILPATCTAIGANAFAECPALANLTAPGVVSVGADAFRGCAALTAVPGAPSALGDYAFAQSGVTSVDVRGVSSLGEGVFAGCAALASATVGDTLPDALFAGCSALARQDWSGVAAFGQASLAGIPAATLALDPEATFADYALAAEEATLATTLAGAEIPDLSGTAALGRELSYTPVAGSVARVEAADLVAWLLAEAQAAEPSVAQPADYSTASLKAWLADGDNAYRYAYADELAADAAFLGLSVQDGRFVYREPSGAGLSVAVSLVGCSDLSAGAWSAEALVWSEAEGAYVAAEAERPSCFARLRFSFDW